MPKLDMIPLGTKMSRLTLIEESSRLGTKRRIICRCDCGKITEVLWQNLKRGASTSCGCYAKEINTTHGESKTHLRGVWQNMQKRCNVLTDSSYKYYGGRGVSVCHAWSDFQEFKSWALASNYAKDLSIERRDVNGNYEPDNCYWADRFIQAANKTKRKGTNTPYIGVARWGKQWAAHVTSHGNRVRIGTFPTPEAAKDARNKYIQDNNLPHTLS